MKNLVRTIALLLLVTISFSGCASDRQQLKDKAIVQGMGIDYRDDKQESGYEITLQVFDVSKSEGSGQSIKGTITTTYSSKGETIFSAIENGQKVLDRNTFMAQNKLLVVGEKVAQSDMAEVLDYYTRVADCRPDVQIAVARGSAKGVIESTCKQSMIPAVKIANTLINGEFNGKSVNIFVFEAINAYKSQTSDMYLPLVKTFGSGKDNNVALDGIAVFQGRKMVGTLDTAETHGLLFINHKISNGNIIINHESLGKITMKITASSSSKKVRIKDGKVYFDVKIKCALNVYEIENGLTDVVVDTDVESFEKSASKKIEKEMRKALKKCLKEYKSDVFDIGKLVAMKDHDFYDQNKDHWEDLLDQIEFSVHADCKVKKIDGEEKK